MSKDLDRMENTRGNFRQYHHGDWTYNGTFSLHRLGDLRVSYRHFLSRYFGNNGQCLVIVNLVNFVFEMEKNGSEIVEGKKLNRKSMVVKGLGLYLMFPIVSLALTSEKHIRFWCSH